MKARSSCNARNAAMVFAASLMAVSAFQLPHHGHGSLSLLTPTSTSTQRVRILEMASGDGDGNVSKRRRRKRKKTEDAFPAAAAPTAADIEKKQSAQAMAQQILSQEQMMFDEEDLTSFTPQNLEEDDRIAAAAQKAGYSVTGGANTQLEDLFDSREFLQRKREKQLEDEENNGRPATSVQVRKKIKRSDIAAYTKLLELDPTADEDDSYFEDEGIDIISALLGDVEPGVGDTAENDNMSGKRVQKKTSFLGIGSGPLQVGHFIGALGVVLMAFVQYPGFPLTNLPDQLRGALQGGLGTIYLVNTVLAVLAAISAPSRNQPSLLWGAKTFAVGGIAYDQLMQIPTPEERAELVRQEQANKMKSRRGRKQK